MKILQIIPSFLPSRYYGGAPEVAYEISKRLKKNGHDVIVYTTDANDPESRVPNGIKFMDGLEVHYFKNVSNSLAYNYKLFISPEMVFSIKNGRFDIIHVHDFRTFQSILSYYCSKILNIPYVLQPHGKPPLDLDPRAKNLKNMFDIIIGNKILQRANKLLVLNETEHKLYMKSNRNIEIIPNGINSLDYSFIYGTEFIIKKLKFRQSYNINSEEQVILYLGRIHRGKGLDLLVKSFSLLLKKVANIRLIIAGPDDGDLQYLRELSTSLKIEDKIIFTGYLSHEEKLLAYANADVFVTPSFWGFPLTFLECMVFGVPIVTTDKGDYIDGIDDETGYVVKYDEKEMENAIYRILLDKEQKENFQRNIKEKIKEYDWDLITNKIERIYKEILDIY